MAKLVQSKTSRYKETPVEGQFTMEDDLLLYPDASDTQTVVGVEERGRLDRVASRVYNNPLLWWALARRNGIINQDDVEPGDVLWVPTVQRIYAKGGILSP